MDVPHRPQYGGEHGPQAAWDCAYRAGAGRRNGRDPDRRYGRPSRGTAPGAARFRGKGSQPAGPAQQRRPVAVGSRRQELQRDSGYSDGRGQLGGTHREPGQKQTAETAGSKSGSTVRIVNPLVPGTMVFTIERG